MLWSSKIKISATFAATLWFFTDMTSSITLNVCLLPSPLSIYASIISDWMSISFSCVVLIISAMVSEYCKHYMPDEKMKYRFNSLVTLFVMSMIILVASPNILSMMIGWDGLGLSSFCLVMFFQNTPSLNSALITLYTNRLGDVIMIMGMCTILKEQTWQPSKNMLISAIFIVLAALTKSAQAPFSAWLPEAMAAPTPVSSLVHSSTLVTAGVYLTIRFFPLVKKFTSTKLLLWTSITTSIIAGTTAWKETDAKKIVAMSTLSQLGMMMFSIALSNWKMTFFHMCTHAMFKALLFITTGYNITLAAGSQDSRKFFSNKTKFSATPTAMMSANISLMGFPFMSGFYSKDLMIENTLSANNNSFIFISFIIICALTTIYTVKMSTMLSTSINKQWLEANNMENNHIYIPTTSLMVPTVASGAFLSNFLPVQVPVCSFLEKFLGVTIMITSVMTTMYQEKKEAFANFSSMTFMKWFSSNMSSKLVLLTKLNSNNEKTWKSLLGPNGLIQMNDEASKIHKLSSPNLSTLLILATAGLIWMKC